MQVSPPQSHLRHSLTDLLGTGGNVRVLRALVSYGGPLSVAQLSRETGLSAPGVRAVLDGLVDRQVAVALGAGRAQLFELHERHPLAGALRELFEHERTRWEGVLAALRTAMESEKEVEAAWYYGSVARGEDGPGSDFDVAVAVRAENVVEDVVTRLREALRPAEEELLVSFSLVGLSRDDVLRLSVGDPWWNDLVRDARMLAGMRPEGLAARLRKRRKAA